MTSVRFIAACLTALAMSGCEGDQTKANRQFDEVVVKLGALPPASDEEGRFSALEWATRELDTITRSYPDTPIATHIRTGGTVGAYTRAALVTELETARAKPAICMSHPSAPCLKAIMLGLAKQPIAEGIPYDDLMTALWLLDPKAHASVYTDPEEMKTDLKNMNWAKLLAFVYARVSPDLAIATGRRVADLQGGALTLRYDWLAQNIRDLRVLDPDIATVRLIKGIGLPLDKDVFDGLYMSRDVVNFTDIPRIKMLLDMAPVESVSELAWRTPSDKLPCDARLRVGQVIAERLMANAHEQKTRDVVLGRIFPCKLDDMTPWIKLGTKFKSPSMVVNLYPSLLGDLSTPSGQAYLQAVKSIDPAALPANLVPRHKLEIVQLEVAGTKDLVARAEPLLSKPGEEGYQVGVQLVQRAIANKTIDHRAVLEALERHAPIWTSQQSYVGSLVDGQIAYLLEQRFSLEEWADWYRRHPDKITDSQIWTAARKDPKLARQLQSISRLATPNDYNKERLALTYAVGDVLAGDTDAISRMLDLPMNLYAFAIRDIRLQAPDNPTVRAAIKAGFDRHPGQTLSGLLMAEDQVYGEYMPLVFKPVENDQIPIVRAKVARDVTGSSEMAYRACRWTIEDASANNSVEEMLAVAKANRDVAGIWVPLVSRAALLMAGLTSQTGTPQFRGTN